MSPQSNEWSTSQTTVTPAEHEALRDLLANARLARERAATLPPGESAPTCPRFRLLVGAYDLERAAFLYWRAEQKKV